MTVHRTHHQGDLSYPAPLPEPPRPPACDGTRCACDPRPCPLHDMALPDAVCLADPPLLATAGE